MNIVLKHSLFFFLFLCQISYAQIDAPISNYDCDDYNSFLSSPSFNNLDYYIDRINSKGDIWFDLSKADEMQSVENIYSLLDVDNGASFQLISTTEGLFEKEKKFLKYQQYHDGVKVLGGGYTEVELSPIGGGNPCVAMSYMLIPHILSDIDVSTTPTIVVDSLNSILNSEDIHSTELVIVHSLKEDCTYNLAWRVFYQNGMGLLDAYVDAHAGTIIRTDFGVRNINAPTINYGEVLLNNRFDGTTHFMISEDGRVRTHDFVQFGSTPCQNIIPPYPGNRIPTTPADEWRASLDGSIHSFQAHHVAWSVVDALDDFVEEVTGDPIGTVDIAVCTAENAFIFSTSNLENMAIELGATGGISHATFDIMAHELGHAFLATMTGSLSSSFLGFNSIHEGFGDILGEYAEFLITGTMDWVNGGDGSTGIELRDLSVPQCFTDLMNAEEHDRGLVFGHWFFLFTNGDTNTGIPSVPIETSIRIVMEALKAIDEMSDFPELRLAILDVIDEEFGPCSDESVAARRAWAQVCVGSNEFSDYSCDDNLLISGPTYLCEEFDNVVLHMDGEAPGIDYDWRWTMIGRNTVNWITSGDGVQSGNSVQGGSTLRVVDIPDYSYYPQYFTIKAYSQSLKLTITKHIVLEDCDGDDPTCEEYHNNINNDSGSSTKFNIIKTSFIKVYDTVGRLLFSGTPSQLESQHISYTGIVIIAHFDLNKRLIKSEKNYIKDQNVNILRE